MRHTYVRIGQMEYLLRGEVGQVRHGRLIAARQSGDIVTISEDRLAHTSVVGDVFAHRVGAVQIFARLDIENVTILFDNTLGAFTESGLGGVAPPILQLPLGIVMAASIVEAVREFVSNHHAHGAVVHHRRAIGLEEGCVDDSRRYGYRILVPIVGCVHHRRWFRPTV